MASPFTISMMFSCYISPSPAEHMGITSWESAAGIESRKWLEDSGLIDAETCRATPKGEAWVQFICDTPLPRQTWVLPPRDGEPS